MFNTNPKNTQSAWTTKFNIQYWKSAIRISRHNNAYQWKNYRGLHKVQESIVFFCFASVKASCRIGCGQMVSRDKHAEGITVKKGDKIETTRFTTAKQSVILWKWWLVFTGMKES